ncbi:IS5/IS1182 family transposase, partial [Rhizobium sp. BUS002]|nr:IS5/IS1182 family transposase [Rhizobium phaseoli]
MDDELFEGLPAQGSRRSAQVGRGAARMREPVRDQIELRAVDIDSLIGQDHAVRV